MNIPSDLTQINIPQFHELAGLVHDKQTADATFAFQFAGMSESGKVKFVVGFADDDHEDEDSKYCLTYGFVYVNARGQVTADYAGMPFLDHVSADKAWQELERIIKEGRAKLGQ